MHHAMTAYFYSGTSCTQVVSSMFQIFYPSEGANGTYWLAKLYTLYSGSENFGGEQNYCPYQSRKPVDLPVFSHSCENK